MIRSFLVICLTAGIISALQTNARAQMFSMDNDRSSLSRITSEVYLGLEPTTVTYQGDESVELPGQFNYDAPIIRVGYNGRSLNLFMGAGGEITGSDNVGYFDVGGNINYGFPLYATEEVLIQLPIQIASRYVNITNSQNVATLDRFRFGSLTAGTGIKAMVRPTQKVRLQAGAVPAYGFSFASGGLFGGSLGSLALNGRLYLDRLFNNNIGLSFGYMYELRNYNVEEERYDYRIKGHSLQLGITF
ncbi:hypothetical protein LQ318_13145 [Aliifodinibius salicampi]|uniref:Outer membrane protein beta-barrel domain-containing protein n=1 Tax=Fodinibius salicampi TaxID=1920655 RepID=A0ABT3Q171_9BACT|nr:hypothetical protein [Fodinibius salicampi]MCW9713850.1 hypothetical protein [Fodinibius salicampi]